MRLRYYGHRQRGQFHASSLVVRSIAGMAVGGIGPSGGSHLVFVVAPSWYTPSMTTLPPWTVNQRALVDVVVQRRALRVPCIIREVRSNRILVELVDVPQRFWVGPEDLTPDVG